ncbi:MULTISPECIES: hypothetical protein [unclassified Bradyrhizobium]
MTKLGVGGLVRRTATRPERIGATAPPRQFPAMYRIAVKAPIATSAVTERDNKNLIATSYRPAAVGGSAIQNAERALNFLMTDDINSFNRQIGNLLIRLKRQLVLLSSKKLTGFYCNPMSMGLDKLSHSTLRNREL